MSTLPIDLSARRRDIEEEALPLQSHATVGQHEQGVEALRAAVQEGPR